MTLLDEITSEEQKVIEELKKRTLQDCTPKMLEDPSLFYRFAKARNFNLKQAESMLRKHIAWRSEFKVDTITDYKAPEVIPKYALSIFVGYDKEGCPIRYVPVGLLDIKGLLSSAKKYDCMKYNILMIEEDMQRCKLQSQKLGKPITKIIYIYDFNKLTFAKATYKEGIDMIIWFISTFQDNYPERIKSIYIINASIYFSIFFPMVKFIIASALLGKIQVLGTDGWKEVLLNITNPEELLDFLGGKRTDHNSNYFFAGEGIVPEHYYLPKSKRTLHQEPGVKRLNVTRFSSANLTFDVTEPGSLLEWEFETKSRDIGFGVYFKDKSWPESKLKSLVPKQRIDTCIEPETGMYKCEKAGTYIIMFDNSYSWIYPKEIYYRAAVLPPPELEEE